MLSGIFYLWNFQWFEKEFQNRKKPSPVLISCSRKTWIRIYAVKSTVFPLRFHTTHWDSTPPHAEHNQMFCGLIRSGFSIENAYVLEPRVMHKKPVVSCLRTWVTIARELTSTTKLPNESNLATHDDQGILLYQKIASGSCKLKASTSATYNQMDSDFAIFYLWNLHWFFCIKHDSPPFLYIGRTSLKRMHAN